MIQFDLTDGELAILKEELESDISDLRMEIADTDSMEYRERLKAREVTLRKVMERLDADASDG